MVKGAPTFSLTERCGEQRACLADPSQERTGSRPPEGDQFCSKFALCSVARQPCGRWLARWSGPRWLSDCQITGLADCQITGLVPAAKRAEASAYVENVSPWLRQAEDTCRPDTCRPDTCRPDTCRRGLPPLGVAAYGASQRRMQCSAWQMMLTLPTRRSSSLIPCL